MRIVHYTLGMPPYRTGGLTKYTWDLMKEQEKSGHKITLLFPGQYGEKGVGNIKYYGENSNIKAWEVENTLPISLLYGVKEPLKYIRKIEFNNSLERFFNEIKPQVFHIHTLMGLPLEIVKLAKEKGCKIIFSTHDYFGICPKVNLIDENGEICKGEIEKCAACNENGISIKKAKILQSKPFRFLKSKEGFNKLKSLKKYKGNLVEEKKEWINLRKENPLIKDYIKLREYYFKIILLADKIHYNSKVTKGVYEGFIKCKNEIIEITHKDIKDSRAIKNFNGDLKILYLGDTVNYKGFGLLLDALEEVKDSKWSLSVYGNKGEIIRESIKNKVNYYGQYTYSKLNNIFKENHILVVPSICNETFGFTLLEGISYGMPVIATNRVGASSLIEKGKGIILEPKKEEFIRALKEVLDNRELLENINKKLNKDSFLVSLESHGKELEKRLYKE